LTAYGFGQAGIVAGSKAALLQAGIGNVSGSTFSVLKSAAAKGIITFVGAME